MTMPLETTGPALDVICLCAAWCGNCRDYQPLFDSLQVRFQGTARFAWIDIEDESEVLGDVEVENFPTLLLLRGHTVLYFGPLTPQAGVLTQLMQTALEGRLAPVPDPSSISLAARVRRWLG
jgi:thioredoxin-like negative regulator of GroEL